MKSLARDIKRLVCRVHPRAPADLRETLSLGNFIDALEDPRLQCRLRGREPKPLSEAVAAALRLDAIAVCTLRGRDPPRRYSRAAKSDEPEPREKDRKERPTPPSPYGISSPPKREMPVLTRHPPSVCVNTVTFNDSYAYKTLKSTVCAGSSSRWIEPVLQHRCQSSRLRIPCKGKVQTCSRPILMPFRLLDICGLMRISQPPVMQRRPCLPHRCSWK